jgi:hypothetical protein
MSSENIAIRIQNISKGNGGYLMQMLTEELSTIELFKIHDSVTTNPSLSLSDLG